MPDELRGEFFSFKELLARRDTELKETLARRDAEHRERGERIDRQLNHIEILLTSKADANALMDLRAVVDRNSERIVEIEEAISVWQAGRNSVRWLIGLALVFVGTLTGLIVLVIDRL